MKNIKDFCKSICLTKFFQRSNVAQYSSQIAIQKSRAYFDNGSILTNCQRQFSQKIAQKDQSKFFFVIKFLLLILILANISCGRYGDLRLPEEVVEKPFQD